MKRFFESVGEFVCDNFEAFMGAFFMVMAGAVTTVAVILVVAGIKGAST